MNSGGLQWSENFTTNFRDSNFFCFCFILYKEKMLTDKATIKSLNRIFSIVHFLIFLIQRVLEKGFKINSSKKIIYVEIYFCVIIFIPGQFPLHIFQAFNIKNVIFLSLNFCCCCYSQTCKY